jgi:hypothetical protein
VAVLLLVGKVQEQLDAHLRLRVKHEDDGGGGGALAQQSREVWGNICCIPGDKIIERTCRERSLTQVFNEHLSFQSILLCMLAD